jgi:hypothetical protein
MAPFASHRPSRLARTLLVLPLACCSAWFVVPAQAAQWDAEP